MIPLQFEADIQASPERVFSLLTDLRTYDQWLPMPFVVKAFRIENERMLKTLKAFAEANPTEA